MRKMVRKLVTVVMICVLMLSATPISVITGTKAEAATFNDINHSSVFIKQGTTGSSGTCTLASAVMMVRRAAMASGNSNWASITESSMKSTAWKTGAGLYYSFTYAGISVKHASLPGGSSNTSTLISLLQSHPEGIMIYDRGIPHAILVTDYTDGIFYCADPSPSYPSGRINISKASVKIANADEYWYVSSPSISLEPLFTSKPSNTKITANLTSIGVGDSVTFEYSINDATSKGIGIDKNGSRYKSIGVNSDSGKYTYKFTEPGTYCCIIEGSNSLGYSCSNGVYVTVIDSKPINCTFSSSLTSIGVGQTVTFNYNITGATVKCIGIDSNGSRYASLGVEKDSGTLNYTFEKAGTYCCFIEGYNSYGFGYSAGVYITVVEGKPTNCTFSSNLTSVGIGDTVTFEYNINGANVKCVGIDSNGSRYASIGVDKDSGTIDYTFEKAGTYCCFIEGYNNYGFGYSEGVYITVREKLPPDYAEIIIVGGNKETYNTGDTITFEFKTINETKKHIGIHKITGEYYDGGYVFEDTYSYTFREVGEYYVDFDSENIYGITRSNKIIFKVVEPHTHSFNIFSYYQSEHPHYAVYKCSCSEEKVSSETSYNSSCVICNPISIVPSVSIKNNTGSKTINYGETLKLTAITSDMPADAKIYWYVDGVKKGEGETFNVSPTSGGVEVTVKIVDRNGNVMNDSNNNEISDSQTVSVNAGFWQKIVSFFKNLFGVNRIIVQSFKISI